MCVCVCVCVCVCACVLILCKFGQLDLLLFTHIVRAGTLVLALANGHRKNIGGFWYRMAIYISALADFS